MRKTIVLLLSITNVLYLPGCRSVHGGTTLTRPGSETIDITRDRERLKEETNNSASSSEFLGKWRSNGEALEPKWRDGDAVPSLPFSHFARSYSKVKESDLISYENNPYESPYEVDSHRDGRGRVRGRGRDSRRRYELREKEGPTVSKEKFLRNGDLHSDRHSDRYSDPSQARPNEYEHEYEHDEEYLKPRPRKRRPPQNDEFVLSGKEAIRIPYAANSKEEVSSKKIEAIKSLIKMQQEEGASLSEILRRKNLTLIDLLKGKEDVISALRMADIDEIGDDIEEISMAMTSSLNKIPSSTMKSFFEVFGTVRAQNATTMAPAFSATNSVENLENSENSTEMSIEFQRDEEPLRNATRIATDEDEIMEFSDFTDYKNGRTTASPIWISLVTENNNVVPVMRTEDADDPAPTILRIFSPTDVTVGLNDENIDKIYDRVVQDAENNNSFNVENDRLPEDDYQYDAPSNDMPKNDECDNSHKDKKGSVKLVVKSEELSKKTRTNDSFPEEMIETIFKHYPNVEETKTGNERYDDIVSELEPEARAEIFELLSSGSGKKLERLLESRNMSLEELIALRQRGSSKVHLADVSRLRNQKASRQPEDERSLTMERPRDREEKGSFLRNGTVEIEIKSSTDETIEPNDFVTREDSNGARENDANRLLEVAHVFAKISFQDGRERSNETREKSNDSNRLAKDIEFLTTFKSLPFGRDHDERFSNDINDNRSISIVRSDHTEDVTGSDLKGNLSTVYELSMSNIKREANEKEAREKSLSKIKSSIIASGAILGVTIVVFLAIFVTCRIRHRQKYRYRNSFPRTVFQSPITTARKLSNTSSLNNIMVNVVATSTTKRAGKSDSRHENGDYDPKCDIDNDSLDANDSWETIPDYMK